MKEYLLKSKSAAYPLRLDHYVDPLCDIAAGMLIQFGKDVRKVRYQSITCEYRDKTDEIDYFQYFPPEIREEIAVYLPITDFFNLRFASRTMASIFESQRFWRTRFNANNECGFASFFLQDEKTGWANRDQNWRLLYHCTKKMAAESPLFEHRKWVWMINQWLRDMCLMETTMIFPRLFNREMSDSGEWQKAERMDLLDRIGRVEGEESNCLWEQTFYIPSSFSAIGISLLREAGQVYITGLEFIRKDLPNINIGCKIPGQIRVDITTLKGIEAAMGPEGMHAIRLIPAKFGPFDRWIGEINNWHTTRISLATPEQEIKALMVSFNVS